MGDHEDVYKWLPHIQHHLPPSSPTGAFFFFVCKKDGLRHPCIDCCSLNITIENNYCALRHSSTQPLNPSMEQSSSLSWTCDFLFCFDYFYFILSFLHCFYILEYFNYCIFVLFFTHLSILHCYYFIHCQFIICLFYNFFVPSFLFLHTVSSFANAGIHPNTQNTHLEHVRLKRLITAHNKIFTDCLEVFICMLHPPVISVKYYFNIHQTSILLANLWQTSHIVHIITVFL